MDVERVRLAQDANVVAAEQVEALLGRLEEGVVPLLVFDTGYDPVKLQRVLEGSAYQILVRCERGGASTATRASPIRLHTSDALVATGRR